jgi:DNA-binding CsgD family transcriptional regulator
LRRALPRSQWATGLDATMAGAVTHGGRRLVVTELQVIAAIARGRTNQEVAADLEIMPTTVKTYLRNTMRKLGAHNRVETVHVENSTACRALAAIDLELVGLSCDLVLRRCELFRRFPQRMPDRIVETSEETGIEANVADPR